MHTYESFDKEDVLEFFHKQQPEVFRFYKRRDPFTFKTVYGLKWM